MYKVVVVEDEKRARQGIVFGTDWASINCVVLGEASNGEEGLEVARKCKPDIIITDIKMPKLSGIEMSEQLVKEIPKLKVIFLTAYSDFTYAQQAVRLGAVDYLVKPFKDGQLEEVIRKLILKINLNKEDQAKNPELVLTKGDKSKYIMDALKFIEENYASKDLSVKMVANYLGVSEGHLGHLFRKETNFTFASYVTKCRMRAARNLLKDYSHKIFEVAELVGYHDITYFSVTFKKYVGVSPSEYQDRYRENDDKTYQKN